MKNNYNSRMTAEMNNKNSKQYSIMQELIKFAGGIKDFDLAYLGMNFGKDNSSKIFKKNIETNSLLEKGLSESNNLFQNELKNKSYETKAEKYFKSLNSLREKEK